MKKRIKIKRAVLAAGLLTLLCVGLFTAGLLLGKREKEPEITGAVLAEQLRPVSRLATTEYHYTKVGKFENSYDLGGWKVPMTKKSFLLSYSGTITAGVDLEKLVVTVSGDKRITVTLPKARLISHEIDENSIELYDETKNIFNPISVSDYTAFTKEQKTAMEEEAAQKGLLAKADEKAAETITSLLQLTPDIAEQYEIIIKQSGS